MIVMRISSSLYACNKFPLSANARGARSFDSNPYRPNIEERPRPPEVPDFEQRPLIMALPPQVMGTTASLLLEAFTGSFVPALGKSPGAPHSNCSQYSGQQADITQYRSIVLNQSMTAQGPINDERNSKTYQHPRAKTQNLMRASLRIQRGV